ncbi:TetR/AcrR family transcriptional regulator [Novosphingopyxis sp. YJ-S2-01]|uniref:TetR/AcrR family transcriptional regulator n=1 Tax=Novosphingopyxis sp. YJ-S2-01 TaxID=2794021 RepID=UPI0018DDD5AF|nr:TetR/AcrR family transcriptional regulator [Novosphingopyxis sp. YJ-S2-01]MBH9536682.1 TetR/AcrR family transcriptional regulator [Novosphingopyxis sp. YJ-S2-01]
MTEPTDTTRQSDADDAKQPRTERGRRTQRKLLDAAAEEFAEKGFHEASIASITRAAGTALGSFYTYFESKDAIFRALVRDLSRQVGRHAAAAIGEETGALAIERLALQSFLAFAREHKEIYRIIDEAEFVDPESYRRHYETIASRIEGRLRAGAETGELRHDVGELQAWAIMGMNVFLGLRYVVWGDEGDAASLAAEANRMIAHGIAGKD